MDIKKLFIKIFAVYFSILLVFVILISVLNYSNSSSRINAEIRNNNFAVLEYTENSLQNAISNLDKNLLGFISDNEFKLFMTTDTSDAFYAIQTQSRLQEKITSFLQLNEIASELYIYREKDGLILSGTTSGSVSDFPDTDWQEAYQNMNTLSCIDGLYMIRRYPTSYTPKDGGLILKLNPQFLKNFTQAYLSSSQIIIRDIDGTVLVGDAKVPLSTPQNTFDTERIRYNKERLVAFHRQCEMPPWILTGLENESEVYLAVNSNLLGMVLIMLLMIVFAAVLFFFINRLAAKPIDVIGEKLNKSILSLKLKTIMDLIHGTNNEKEILENLNTLNIPLFNEHFVVLLIQSDTLNEEVQSNIESIVTEHTRGFCCLINKSQLIVVLSFNNIAQEDILEISSLIAEYIKTLLIYEFNCDFLIGAGEPVSCLSDIGKSYNQAVNALKYYAVKEHNTIIFFHEIKNKSKIEFYDILSCIKKIEGSLSVFRISNAQEEMQKLFEFFRTDELSIDHIRQFCLQLANSISKIAVEQHITIECASGFYDIVFETPSLDELYHALLGMLNDFGNEKNKIEDKKLNPVIHNVIKYINENYSDAELSLSSIADKFNISVSYLSRLFKNIEGKTFLEYLIDCRMEHAKQLLSKTEMQISAISNAVGYKNYPSFAKTFKNLTGLTPGEFREQL